VAAVAVVVVALAASIVPVVAGGRTTARMPSPSGRSLSGTALTRSSGGARAVGGSTTSIPESAATRPPATADATRPGVAVNSGQDQSDPFLLLDRGRYLLYTSGIPASGSTRAVNVPVARTSNFVTWSKVTDALPVLPRWAVTGYTWAPDVHRFGSGWVLYFSAGVRETDRQCIGVATGPSPTGPFTARGTPFICQSALGGSIDPRVFTDRDGAEWMLWKSDQNIGGASTPTTMWSQRLSADGLRLVGTPSVLMRPDKPWEGTVVEAPDMIRVGTDYWLVFSGNWFNQPDYAVGAALCAGPAGPCADTSPTPLLASNAQGFGPGEASLFADAHGIWLLYSPWFFPSAAPHSAVTKASLATDNARRRQVDITRIGVAASGPYLAAGGPPPALSNHLGRQLLAGP
jgi:GH43 family beta-xylosidase